MFDQLNVKVVLGSGNITGVWEFFNDDYFDSTPDNVTDLSGSLKFEINNFLGSVTRVGTKVRVYCSQTSQYEDCISTYAGGKNIITTVGVLGQNPASPSINAGDYIIGSLWNVLENVVDETVNFTSPGDRKVTFDLPQTTTKNWKKTSTDETGAALGLEGYYIRFRVIAVTVATNPTLDLTEINHGGMYVIGTGYQGISIFNESLLF